MSEYLRNLIGNTFNPYRNPAANNLMDGVPRHTEWDVYAEQYVFNEGQIFTPNTNDAYGGAFGNYTDFAPDMDFVNPQSVIVFAENQNYQGIAPIEMQPTLDLPEPWEQ